MQMSRLLKLLIKKYFFLHFGAYFQIFRGSCSFKVTEEGSCHRDTQMTTEISETTTETGI